jgi:hypothetical protein
LDFSRPLTRTLEVGPSGCPLLLLAFDRHRAGGASAHDDRARGETVHRASPGERTPSADVVGSHRRMHEEVAARTHLDAAPVPVRAKDGDLARQESRTRARSTPDGLELALQRSPGRRRGPTGKGEPGSRQEDDDERDPHDASAGLAPRSSPGVRRRRGRPSRRAIDLRARHVTPPGAGPTKRPRRRAPPTRRTTTRPRSTGTARSGPPAGR